MDTRSLYDPYLVSYGTGIRSFCLTVLVFTVLYYVEKCQPLISRSLLEINMNGPGWRMPLKCFLHSGHESHGHDAQGHGHD